MLFFFLCQKKKGGRQGKGWPPAAQPPWFIKKKGSRRDGAKKIKGKKGVYRPRSFFRLFCFFLKNRGPGSTRNGRRRKSSWDMIKRKRAGGARNGRHHPPGSHGPKKRGKESKRYVAFFFDKKRGVGRQGEGWPPPTQLSWLQRKRGVGRARDGHRPPSPHGS